MKQRAVVMGAAAIFAAALMSCREAADKTPEDTTYRLRPGYVVDSVRPIEVELQRFRDSLGAAPTEFTGGATSIDALVRKFARAVAAGDSAALDSLQITRAEFAWLIYPVSPFTNPPYRETPQMLWYLLRSSGDRGFTRLLQRRGGAPLAISGHECPIPPAADVWADVTIWRHCQVKTVTAGQTKTETLFGAIYERAGRFKFASFENQY